MYNIYNKTKLGYKYGNVRTRATRYEKCDEW